MNELVSTEWLHENLNKEGFVILDASLPTTALGKDYKYMHTTIPLARSFDLKNHFSDTTSNFPNTSLTQE